MKHTFIVPEMHCNACIALTEGEVEKLSGVTSAHARLADKTIAVTTSTHESREALSGRIATALKPYSYTVADHVNTSSQSSILQAVPYAIAIIGIFIVVQKMGIVQLIPGGQIGYSTAFIVGVIASLSSCMAVVGGLILSLSSHITKATASKTPYTLFHIGRLVGFFLLGGVLGLVGSSFHMNLWTTIILNFVVAGALILLGLGLLDNVPWAKRFQLALPASWGKRITQGNLRSIPLLLGAGTFFMPCGFTQSMQLYALSTGTFLQGALVMFFFAMGTLPVLATLSYGSGSLQKKFGTHLTMNIVGLVVIFFGIFTLANALAAAGIIPPLFSL